jgi:hypothetical protein
MKMKLINFLTVAITFSCLEAKSQGFVNLNFEHPILPLTPFFNDMYDPASAIPGWTAYVGGNPSLLFYNGISAGGAMIALEDTNNISPKPIQGKYSVFLAGDTTGSTSSAIGQTGQIPNSALSVLFYVTSGNTMLLSFNGQSIPLFFVSATTNYVVMGGDVSTFAGQTGELLFTKPPRTAYGLIDNIQFSSAPIPEPNSLALVVLGCGLFGFRHWRRISKT